MRFNLLPTTSRAITFARHKTIHRINALRVSLKQAKVSSCLMPTWRNHRSITFCKWNMAWTLLTMMNACVKTISFLRMITKPTRMKNTRLTFTIAINGLLMLSWISRLEGVSLYPRWARKKEYILLIGLRKGAPRRKFYSWRLIVIKNSSKS